MRDVDATLMQQILDITEPKRVAHIHHHREADNLGRGFEISKRARAYRMPTYPKAPFPESWFSSDTALDSTA
jgi:hypothetical protein